MRNSYLRKMGIDVWVPRDRSPGNPGQSVLVDASEPTFHLCFLNYRSFGACLLLEDDQEVISPVAKRFIADIALSMSGSAKQPTLINLKWPVSKRESSDQSGKTPEEAVLHRLNGLPALVLVFGGDAMGAIPGLAGDGVPTSDLNGHTILVMDSIDELCKGATGKKKLWRQLNEARDLS